MPHYSTIKQLARSYVLLIFIDVLLNSVFALPFLFLSFLSIVILVSCITNFFFLDLVVELAL